MTHEAMLYKKLENGNVQCQLCAHRCFIKDGEKGKCLVRINEGGQLNTLVFGKTISQHVDPIEKKPLYHFQPGSYSYSIATPGCNFTCQWCQNWEISQMPKFNFQYDGDYSSPEEIVKRALAQKCKSIAYTYTEPTIFFEYAYQISQLAKGAQLANVFVTNGYMTEEMLALYHPWLDAANVDIKAFSDKTYQKYIGAHLQPVLDSCKRMKALGIWLEITTLVIPGINDDLAEMKALADFIVTELGAETPWHISRYYPNYQFLKVSATPPKILTDIEAIGFGAGLKYVYVGNLQMESITKCPNCKTTILKRWGNQTEFNNITPEGCCPNCGAMIAGVGMYGR